MKKIIIGVAALICVQSLKAQDDKSESPSYNPHQLFTQNFNPPPGTETRSVKGVPGHAYWQNSASYLIHATLSEKDTSVTGDVTISYTNNSPDELDYLWLQAEQNLFNPSSRSAATALYPADNYSIPGGGYQIKDVTVTYEGKSYTVKPIITDTRMQVR
ncbi:MAG: M1 family peptidase, partial [Bacteroidota bacterium]